MSEALVIDDNRTTADALRQMLAFLGFKARVAYGSGAGMTVLGSGFIPGLVCLDINMPGLDGNRARSVSFQIVRFAIFDI